MNILSFDIEEWSIEKEYHGGRSGRYAEYDRLLDRILELLNEREIRATFFCLGKIALDFPDVIKKIDSFGHEIGSHSHSHRWINKMTPQEFREDTHCAISAIEDLIGKKVKSFRAPAFSIGEENKWALEVLLENGIENDASIFPGVRDFGGFPNFKEESPCIIEIDGMQINEFPIPLYRLPIIYREIAFSGGGYFRLLPLWFVKKVMTKATYNMCYFHLNDLMPGTGKMLSKQEYEDYFKEPGTFKNRAVRHFKSNVGRRHALAHFHNIIDTFPFISIERYNNISNVSRIIHL